MISKLIVAILIIGQAFGEYDEINLSLKCEARPACNCDMTEVERLRELVENLSERSTGNCDLTELERLNERVQNLTAQLESYHRSIPCQFRAERGWFGVEGDDGRCYQYQKTATRQNWHDGRELCQAEGGDLAHLGIRSDNVKSEVISNVAENDAVYIGLNDIQSEGTYVWIDGSLLQLNELTWVSGQPDNLGNNEDCVDLNQFRSSPIRGNDAPCNTFIIPALCERLIGSDSV